MKRRKDGRLVTNITINGKRVFFYGKTERELKQKIANYKAEQSRHTFKDVAEEWQETHREEIGVKTWTNYKPHYEDILKLHGKKDVTEITALDVQNDLQRAKAQGCSATIISTRRSLFRMILDYALFKQWITYNPALSVRMPKDITHKTREAPTDNVMQIILNNADKPFGLYPLFLLCTGMRRSEVLCLLWSDISDDSISVTKALDYSVHAHPVVKTPKTEAGVRTVPLHEPLRSAMLAQAPDDKSQLVFPPLISPLSRSKNTSSYMTERQFETAWKNYCTSVGLVDQDSKPTLTAHQLRHGFATLGFEAGVDEKTMQLILGHSSATVTRDIYQHLRDKKRALSEQKLGERLGELSKLNEVIMKSDD